MAQAPLNQAIVEKESEAALAYQSNLLFQNVNQSAEKDHDFFLGSKPAKKKNNTNQTKQLFEKKKFKKVIQCDKN